MAKGLTFWWFDANWGISIPPPNVKYGGHGDGAAWDGMDNRVWGSHVYFMTAKMYDLNNPVREYGNCRHEYHLAPFSNRFLTVFSPSFRRYTIPRVV